MNQYGTHRSSVSHRVSSSPAVVGMGRSSMSALDERRDDAIRRGVYTYMANNSASRTTSSSSSNTQGSTTANKSSNYNPSSSSGLELNSPPTTSRPTSHHQRHFSASASLPRSYDESLLKPPPRFQRLPVLTRLPALNSPTTMASPAAVSPHYAAFQHVHSRGPHYPPARDGREQSTEDFAIRTERANSRIIQQQHQQPQGSYFALQAQSMDSTTEGFPDHLGRYGMYNRPRRLSNSSNASTVSTASASMASRDSFESRMRSSSWSSQTSFESFYSAQSSPYSSRNYPQYPWQRPAPLKQFRKKAKPGELFAALPGEVLELILEELKKLHLAPGSTSCATCWMRDCCSIAIGARKLHKYARAALYEDIQLVGADSAHQRKKYKPLLGTRMVLLRRTLRASPHIAAIVRSLKVPAMPQAVNPEEYTDVVASLVMACPNLERVVGFYPPYDHSFSRFFHALSTRQRLKEMNWIVETSPYQRQHRIRSSSGNQRGMMLPQKNNMNMNMLTPGDLQPQQSASFLDHHGNWQYLNTLTVHCRPGATLAPDSLLIDAVMCLPALRNLHLSHLPHTAFNDTGLLSLPPLKKLSLIHLSGISSAGLSAFATRGTSRSLETLTLVHVDVDSLPVLARMLSNLRSLTTFSLVQPCPPVLPQDETIWLFPYLASASLRKLHWDIPTHPTRANAADSILARSIAAGGFPSLSRLRAPADPEGIFQSLCRPMEKVDLPGDRYRGGVRHNPSSHSGSGHAYSTSNLSSFGGHSYEGSNASSLPSLRDSAALNPNDLSPTSPGFGPDATRDSLAPPRDNSDLHAARLAAQARLEAARRFPRFFVNVIDEDGILVEKYGVAGFIGSAESNISYRLVPDLGGVDEKGGLVDVADLLGDGGEDLTGGNGSGVEGSGRGKEWKVSGGGKGEAEPAKMRDGCTGRWNTYSGLVVDKKDRDRWWHTERGRWRGVTLS